MSSNFTPWVEKYRPTSFDEIVFDPLNKKLLENIINNKSFPNLLFYGPPGTGKTTSIINLINAYQDSPNCKNLMIHLNASDERGIDIIRNQINSFVNSKSLFNDGMKFVILDEVDYMTKNAQIALKYLLQSYKSKVRFCLICNYISRIDEALQNEFVRLRFNQLPQDEIITFLRNINECEKLDYSEEALLSIQKLFNSDIRSMINYMQSNEKLISNMKIMKDELWIDLINRIKNKDYKKNIEYINNLTMEYNIEKKNIIKNFLNFIIRHKKEYVTTEFLLFIENVMHISDLNIEYMLPHCLIKLNIFFTQN
jgi:DNA polymerase III delta prime subunit|uniref:AAA+ ATPase domain-containing protein n=1 Tax=viral metagenome TaxID=1070528 RepID=A0A6C0CWG4_9ZZZZ